MTVRLAPSIDTPRESRRVKTVALLLELDESQVRRLIEDRELETHGIGKRGVRIYLDSVLAYQERKPGAGSRPDAKTAADAGAAKKPASATRAAHKAATAQLQALGVL